MTIVAFLCGMVTGTFLAVLVIGLLSMASGPEMQYRTEEMLERAARESWESEH